MFFGACGLHNPPAIPQLLQSPEEPRDLVRPERQLWGTSSIWHRPPCCQNDVGRMRMGYDFDFRADL